MNWFKKNFQNKLYKNILTLLTGSILAQAIPIAISPILTRIYAPEEFGVFSFFIAITSILVVLSTARYEMAIMLPKEDRDAYHVLLLALLLSVVFFVVSIFLILIFHNQLVNLFNLQKYSQWLYYIPIAVLLMALFQCMNFWMTRKNRYKLLSSSKVVQSAGMSSIQLSLSNTGSLGLLLGILGGQVISCFTLTINAVSKDKFFRQKSSMKKIREQATVYKDFPKVNLLHALSDQANTNGTLFMINYFFSSSILGQYSLMMRVLNAPLSLVGASLTQVFYEHATKIYHDKGDLHKIIVSFQKKLALIAMIPAIIIIFFAPDLFSFIFGENWREAGIYSRYLVPYIFFHFLVSPLAYIPIIINKQKQAFYFSLTGNILFLVCIFIGSLFGSVFVALLLISIILSAYFIVYIFWIMRITEWSRLY